jgi:bla regulator protein blaR1
MIAAFAVYATLLSVAIGVIAWLAHQVALMTRVSTRFVWLAAMLLMVFAPVAASLVSSRSAVSVPTMSAVEVDASLVSAPGLRAPDVALLEGERRSWRDLPRAFDDLLRATAEGTRPFDRVLGGLWALASLSLLLIARRAARRLRELRRTLVAQDVEGVTVYVSPNVGPAAVGGAMPAIVVPAWVLSLDRSLLTLVLTHEQEHLAARDPALLGAGLALLIMVPWLLPLWWCWQRLRLAIELDCDARVLRAHPSPRVYAQLLLFVSQRRATLSASWPLLSPLTLAFNPQVHHLTSRIDAMTQRASKHPLRLACIGVALVGTAATAMTIPTPSIDTTVTVSEARTPAVVAPLAREAAATAPPVIVSITYTGLTFAATPSADSLQIVLYGNGPVRVGLGTQPRALLADTLVLTALPAFTADVSEGELHIELRRGARLLEVRGDIEGGPAVSVSATGRHLVLSAGGTGIRTVGEAGVGGLFAP